MKRLSILLASTGLIVVAAGAAAQIRIPGRPVVPPSAVPTPVPTPAPAPAPTPIRISGRPTIPPSVIAPTPPPSAMINPNALARNKVGVQAQCLYQLVPALGPERVATGTTDLTCMIGGKAVMTMFRFGPPNGPQSGTPLDKINDNQARGFASVVTYSQAPTGTDPQGRPIYDIYNVAEGPQSVQRVVCVAGGKFNSSSLYVGSRDRFAPGVQASTWCSDGKQVTPMNFLITDGIWSTMKGWYDFNTPSPADAVVEVLYYSNTGAGTAAQPFLVGSTRAVTGMKYASVSPVGKMQYCSPPPATPASIYCYQTTGSHPNYTHTQFLVWAAANLRTFWETPPDPNKSSPRNKQIGYTLLPGTVPTQYRNQIQGACYVAATVSVSYEYSSGIGVGMAKPDGPYFVMNEPQGKSSGDAAKYTDAKAPC